MSQSSSNSNLKGYIDLIEGDGGIFSFPMDYMCLDGTRETATAVGSWGCITCVCVHIPLEDNLCFAAHISAGYHCRKPSSKFSPPAVDDDDDDDHWIPRLEDVETVSQIVEQKLSRVHPEIVEKGIPAHLKPRIAIVSPRREVQGYDAFGQIIIDAVGKVFKLDNVEQYVKQAQGFIVDYQNDDKKGIPRYLYWKSDDGEVEKSSDEHDRRISVEMQKPEDKGYKPLNEASWRLLHLNVTKAWNWFPDI